MTLWDYTASEAAGHSTALPSQLGMRGWRQELCAVAALACVRGSRPRLRPGTAWRQLPALPAGVKVICFTALQRSVSLGFADVVNYLPLTRGSSGELLGCSYELALQLLLETATSNLRRILEVR